MSRVKAKLYSKNWCIYQDSILLQRQIDSAKGRPPTLDEIIDRLARKHFMRLKDVRYVLRHVGLNNGKVIPVNYTPSHLDVDDSYWALLPGSPIQELIKTESPPL
jgi:hypothetical protein